MSWRKGFRSKITETGLVDFIDLWDSSTIEQRAELLRQCIPSLFLFEITEHSQRQAHQLRHGVLLAIVGLLEGSLKIENDADQ
jgi:hypothetical protein